MTVAELIATLSKVDPELRVLFKTTDPTDYTYVVAVEEEHIMVSNAMGDSNEDDDDLPIWDEDGETEIDYLVIKIDV